MFAYTMLATSPLFCYPDWPRRFFGHFPEFLRPILPITSPPSQTSSSCVYPKLPTGSAVPQEAASSPKPSSPRLKHKLRAIFTIIYIIEQLFLPYSHFITQVCHATEELNHSLNISHIYHSAFHQYNMDACGGGGHLLCVTFTR